MRKTLVLLLFLWLLIPAASAMELQTPAVPSSAEACLPREQQDLLGGLGELLTNALREVVPGLRAAGKSCLGVLAAVMLCALISPAGAGEATSPGNLLGVSAISICLLESTQTFLRLGLETAHEIGAYSTLLLPAMSAALVASGGTTKASALYLGTAFCNNVLTRVLSSVMEPLLYTFIGASVAHSTTGNDLLKRLAAFFKGCMTWCLKLVLYVFTGYMTITGVISGSVDATALRATKLAISGVVPVVGGILSDASEAILVGTGAVRGTLGLGGVFVVLSIAAVPFITVAAQHLVLKLTGALCGIVGNRYHGELVNAFGQAMGLILAMVGTSCLLQLISIICFLKGVNG